MKNTKKIKKVSMLISFLCLAGTLCMVSPKSAEAADNVVSQGESIQSAINSLGKNGGEIIVEEGTYKEFITFMLVFYILLAFLYRPSWQNCRVLLQF